ncbi:MAG TPA: serine protease [Streptosporangiaceae bacterium]
MTMPVRRRSGRHAGNRAATWLRRPAGRLTVVGVLTLGVVVTVTPANGAATDIASHVANAFRGIVSNSETAQAFPGTPAVGALFTSAQGKLGSHFCTASVVHSPQGNLGITAAHCVTGLSGTIVFVPGYRSGTRPYGVWTVSKIYIDHAWTSGSSQNDDVAFIRLTPQTGSGSGSGGPIENVTGAETLATKSATKEMVEVIGYPDSSEVPVACRNWTSQPMSGQLEFDCGGYTDGTSGGPFLADVAPGTGQGVVVGVIGGYNQGGFTPDVSYSSQFGDNVASLYATAIAGG